MNSAHAFGSHLAHLRNAPHRSAEFEGELGAGIEAIPRVFTICMIIPLEELTVDDLVYWLVAAAMPSWTTHLELQFKGHQDEDEIEVRMVELLTELREHDFVPTHLRFCLYANRYGLRMSLFGNDERAHFQSA
jgi:hypothetical protein